MFNQHKCILKKKKNQCQIKNSKSNDEIEKENKPK
jgi:hypothetical protein